MARPPKKARPTFDVARDPITDTQSGWVYRTEGSAAPEVRPVEPIEPIREQRREHGDVFSPREQAPETSIAYQVLATGVYLMTLPVRISVNIMMTPVHWILGSRR